MRTYVDFQVIKDVFLRNMVCDIILKNKKKLYSNLFDKALTSSDICLTYNKNGFSKRYCTHKKISTKTKFIWMLKGIYLLTRINMLRFFFFVENEEQIVFG